MSVKKKDRHVSQSEALQVSRTLVHQVLTLTHPREYDDTGKLVRRPGILAEGQPFFAFGNDILTLSKQIHAKCYKALDIKLKDEESLVARNDLHKDAVSYCDSIMRLVDLCIFEYGSSKKKKKSFEYLARLTYTMKKSIQDRMNRDNLIYEHNYKVPHHHRRGR